MAKITNELKEKIKKMLLAGMPATKIQKETTISRVTIGKIAKTIKPVVDNRTKLSDLICDDLLKKCNDKFLLSLMLQNRLEEVHPAKITIKKELAKNKNYLIDILQKNKIVLEWV